MDLTPAGPFNNMEPVEYLRQAVIQDIEGKKISLSSNETKHIGVRRGQFSILVPGLLPGNE